MDRPARLRVVELAIAELLESETNGSLALGGGRCDREPLVIRALGCSVLLSIGRGDSVLVPVGSLRRDRVSGARALAILCEQVIGALYGLPRGSVPTVAFDNPTNAAGWAGRRA
jgi:hypothetical protein